METKEAILGRRSIRKYIDKPVELELLQEIIEAAIMAPSAMNTQPWFFVVVQSPGQLENLRDIFRDVSLNIRESLEKRFPNNPEVVAETIGFLAGLGYAKVCVLVFLLNPNEDYNILAVQSTSAAIENLCIMAYDKGLGSCWMTAPFETGFGPVLEHKFAAGKGKFVAAVTLGYPAVIPQAPKRKSGRYIFI